MGIVKLSRLSVLGPMRLLSGEVFLGLSFSGCNIRVPLVGGCEVCEADLQENVTAKMSSSRARETALARSKTEARKVHVP